MRNPARIDTHQHILPPQYAKIMPSGASGRAESICPTGHVIAP